MTLCKQRSDLIGTQIPLKVHEGVMYGELTKWHPCEQPDELDDKEFNVKIYLNEHVIYASSIDLEFKDKENE